MEDPLRFSYYFQETRDTTNFAKHPTILLNMSSQTIDVEATPVVPNSVPEDLYLLNELEEASQTLNALYSCKKEDTFVMTLKSPYNTDIFNPPTCKTYR